MKGVCVHVCIIAYHPLLRLIFHFSVSLSHLCYNRDKQTQNYPKAAVKFVIKYETDGECRFTVSITIFGTVHQKI